MAESASSMTSNVQVAVRCRPVNSEERKSGQATVISCLPESKSIQVSYGAPGKKMNKSYAFDKVFGMYSTQEEVFSTVVRPIVDEALAGFNCTIFAYGQTGTGKTYTMEGDITSEEHAGIVPRTVKFILEQLESSGAEFTIRVSFLELYNEELQDLLNLKSDKKLKLCEDVNKGVVCQNLEEITVLSVNDIFEILQRGIQNRQTAATLCNKNSSRSHSIFTMKIMVKECSVDGEEVVRHGQLNLVDLAGSECVGRSGAKNDRAREAGNINQSLLTLGRVITALVDHHSHVPYRDSKLTRILQESLGGKAKTCIIATLSPSQLAAEESMSTLEYAYRARSIKNQPTVNQKMTKKVVLKEYCAEIEYLRSQLQLTREKNGVYLDPNDFYQMESKIAAQDAQLQECESALKHRTEEVKQIKTERDEFHAKVEETNHKLEAMQTAYNETCQQLADSNNMLEVVKDDLRAAEAVVEEQTKTEDTLYTAGKSMQSEINQNRDDIKSLFQKIQRFQSKQSENTERTRQFVLDIADAKSKLDVFLRDCCEQNQKESKMLCSGVSELVQRGQSTCEILNSAIEVAVKGLLNDSEKSFLSMQSSCDNVEQSLRSSFDDSKQTLLALQSQLNQWLNDVIKSVLTMTNFIDSQQKIFEQMQETTKTVLVTLNAKNSEFLNAHDNGIKQLSAHINELQSNVQSTLKTQQEISKQNIDTAKSQFATQIQSIEQEFTDKLRSLLTMSTNTFAFLETNNSKTAEKVESIVTASVSSMQDSKNAIAQSLTILMSEQNKALSSYETSTQNKILEAINTATELRNGLENVASTAPMQRDHIASTVESLVVKSEQVMQTSCKSVNETSKTAVKTGELIKSATVTMKTKVDDAKENFSSFLENQGKELTSVLVNHFQVMETSLDSHRVNIDGIQTISSQFESELPRQALEPTGSTPSKRSFGNQLSLPRTRDHSIIRNEAKGIKMDASIMSTGSGSKRSASRVSDISDVSCDDSSSQFMESRVERSNSSASLVDMNDDEISISSANVSLGSKKRKVVNDSISTKISTATAVEPSNQENCNPNGSVSSKVPRISRTTTTSLSSKTR